MAAARIQVTRWIPEIEDNHLPPRYSPFIKLIFIHSVSCSSFVHSIVSVLAPFGSWLRQFYDFLLYEILFRLARYQLCDTVAVRFLFLLSVLCTTEDVGTRMFRNLLNFDAFIRNIRSFLSVNFHESVLTLGLVRYV